MTINNNSDTLSFRTTSFRTTSFKKESNNFLRIDLEGNYIYGKKNETLFEVFNKKFPVWFSYDAKDEIKDIKKREEGLDFNPSCTEYLNDDNIFVENISFETYKGEYRLYVDMKNKKSLMDKISTLDYELDCYYYNGSFVVQLVYVPNIRKVKIEKIKKLINKNVI